MTKASHDLDIRCSVQPRPASALALDANTTKAPRYWAPHATKAGHSLDSGISVNRNHPLYLRGPRTASTLGTLHDKGQPRPRPQPWLLCVTKASHGLDLGCSMQSRPTSTLALDAQHNQGRPRHRYWAPHVTKATAST